MGVKWGTGQGQWGVSWHLCPITAVTWAGGNTSAVTACPTGGGLWGGLCSTPRGPHCGRGALQAQGLSHLPGVPGDRSEPSPPALHPVPAQVLAKSPRACRLCSVHGQEYRGARAPKPQYRHAGGCSPSAMLHGQQHPCPAHRALVPARTRTPLIHGTAVAQPTKTLGSSLSTVARQEWATSPPRAW